MDLNKGTEEKDSLFFCYLNIANLPDDDDFDENNYLRWNEGKDRHEMSGRKCANGFFSLAFSCRARARLKTEICLNRPN